MRAYDIIEKKKNSKKLTKEEIEFFINGYLDETIKDYQMSALLMAICLNGMDDQECEYLTSCMLNSGDKVDLSEIDGIKVDKHSTGGVGDKTTLILTPIVACCGVKVAKMSGRGLGHTGGTVDKLESISGMKLDLKKEKFFDIVNKVGCCVISQTGNLVPADKKIYALRDVTATVESIPLIASSIMSKKLASGADCIVLDVKVGDGAFMKTVEDAIKLSTVMVNIGLKFNKKVSALITNMEEPLGTAIGNSLEVWEACEILKGRGANDLREVSLSLASQMLEMAGKGTYEQCREMASDALYSGRALSKLKDMICAQGGDICALDKSLCCDSEKVLEFCADRGGYIQYMHADKLGKAAMVLGAGRQKKEECIDYNSGIILHKKIGDEVKKGDVIATLYTSDSKKGKDAIDILKNAIEFSDEKTYSKPLILAKVSYQGVERYC